MEEDEKEEEEEECKCRRRRRRQKRSRKQTRRYISEEKKFIYYRIVWAGCVSKRVSKAPRVGVGCKQE